MNRKVLLVGIALVLPLLVLLFVNLGRDPHAIKSPMIGRPAPGFLLPSVDSREPVSLQAFRGKPLVVNFWATWCVPCFEEHRFLTAAARQMQPDVQFLGVVFNDEESAISRFLEQNGRSYPMVMDEKGKTAIAYGVYGVPETFFVDPAGTIVAKYEGPLTPDALNENLQKAMKR